MAQKKLTAYERFGTTGEPDDIGDGYETNDVNAPANTVVTGNKEVYAVDDFTKTQDAKVIDTKASKVDTVKDKEKRDQANMNSMKTDESGSPHQFAEADKYQARTADGRVLSLPLPNNLRNYSSFNYIIGLYALTNEELNNPDESYRVKKPKYAILQSGGGLEESKVITAYESKGKKVEYYINGLEIETIIAPTRKKGSTNAVGFRLEIQEPYSMGLFLQTLQLASYQAGHENYLESPFLLTIDFIGYDDNGKVYTVPEGSKNLPFKLVGSDLSVTEGGSSYVVEGVAYNEAALVDHTQRIPVDVTLTGRNLEQMLQSNLKSLAQELNAHEAKKATDDKIFTANQYFVVFPKERASAGKLSSNYYGTSSGATDGSATQSEASTINTGPILTDRKQSSVDKLEELYNMIAQGGPPPEAFAAWAEQTKKLVSTTQLGQDITDKQTGAKHSNNIGLANIFNLDSLGTTNQPFGDASFTYDKDKQVWVRSSGQLQIDPGLGTIKFLAGTRIQDIIEECIILSDYGKNIIDAPAVKGMRPWFKIDTQVFNITDRKTEKKTGVPPRIYVFRVLPYMVHESKFIAPDETPAGLNALRIQTCKRYNYIYSGANEDILDLEINLDNTFFKSVSPGTLPKNNLADGSKEGEDPSLKTTMTPTNNDSQVNNKALENRNNNAKAAGAVSLDDMRVDIARRFNEAIVNSDVDLLTIDMTIMGDPYYIADSGIGNYNSENTQFINLDADGSIDYQYGEVDVEVLFRTPIDYRDNGIMGFPDDTVPVDFFSGLYMVISVKNEFAAGQFKQVLELVKRPQMSEKATADSGEKGTQEIKTDNAQGTDKRKEEEIQDATDRTTNNDQRVFT